MKKVLTLLMGMLLICGCAQNDPASETTPEQPKTKADNPTLQIKFNFSSERELGFSSWAWYVTPSDGNYWSITIPGLGDYGYRMQSWLGIRPTSAVRVGETIKFKVCNLWNPGSQQFVDHTFEQWVEGMDTYTEIVPLCGTANTYIDRTSLFSSDNNYTWDFGSMPVKDPPANKQQEINEAKKPVRTGFTLYGTGLHMIFAVKNP